MTRLVFAAAEAEEKEYNDGSRMFLSARWEMPPADCLRRSSTTGAAAQSTELETDERWACVQVFATNTTRRATVFAEGSVLGELPKRTAVARRSSSCLRTARRNVEPTQNAAKCSRGKEHAAPSIGLRQAARHASTLHAMQAIVWARARRLLTCACVGRIGTVSRPTIFAAFKDEYSGAIVGKHICRSETTRKSCKRPRRGGPPRTD